MLNLGQKSRGGLNWILGCGVASRKRRRPEVRDALEPFGYATDKNLAAPDAAVVAIARAVETHAHYGSPPLATFRQH